MRALVVFHGNYPSPGWWDRFLRPGFRHCFVVLNDGIYWVIVDGVDGVPEIRVGPAASHDLAAYYRARDFTVVEVDTGRIPPRQPFMLGTCVGAAKRLLAIRAPFVFTPLQLFRHLRRHGCPAA